MTLLIPILLLSFLAIGFALPVFEWVFFVFLSTPVLGFLAGKLGFELNLLSYAACMLIICALSILTLSAAKPKFRLEIKNKTDLIPIAVFCAAFAVTYRFCMLWPDFIAMGERLRDYAMLASNINSPIEAREPWMSGYALNYYLYWYRFGHFLSSILQLHVWQVYHVLAAFSAAFYFSACYRIMQRHLRFSHWTAMACAAIILFGSNIAGVQQFFAGDQNWWGPSRVIKGAIDEFPAWSFLLGDLHPHYLNLALIPFFLCLSLEVLRKPSAIAYTSLWGLAALIMAPIWIYNSNAWEVPVWCGLLLCSFFCLGFYLHAYLKEKGFKPVLFEAFSKEQNAFSWSGLFAGFFLIGLLIISLYLSSRNLNPPHYPYDLVKPPVPRTTLAELLLHWGFPLSLMALSFLFLLKKWPAQIAAYCGLWILLKSMALSGSYALAVLILFLILTLIKIFKEYVNPLASSREERLSLIITNALGLAALGLIILPEIVFMNDPYGGENERMNTIFKAYSAAWFMLHIYAFSLTRQAFAAFSNTISKFCPIWLMHLIALVVLLGFFANTIQLRKNSKFSVSPYEQGLSSLDREFPGAAQAIKRLEQALPGVVLEAQGNPYSYTTHVSTLAGKQSYLGWINHVDLLLSAMDETRRRAEVTEKIYKASTCSERAALMQQEGIKYLVVGPLEKVKYPQVNSQDYSCLGKLVESGQYRIFAN